MHLVFKSLCFANGMEISKGIDAAREWFGQCNWDKTLGEKTAKIIDSFQNLSLYKCGVTLAASLSKNPKRIKIVSGALISGGIRVDIECNS